MKYEHWVAVGVLIGLVILWCLIRLVEIDRDAARRDLAACRDSLYARPPIAGAKPVVVDNGSRAYLVTHGEGWDQYTHDFIPAGRDTFFSTSLPSGWRYSLGHFWNEPGEFFVQYPITVTDLCGDTLWTLTATRAKAESEDRARRSEAVLRSLEDCP